MILISTVLESGDEWLQAFLAEDKDLPIALWQEGMDLSQVEFAVIAKPQAGVLENIPNLKAIFSLWAGVEASVQVPNFPKNVPLYRMVDENMASAIAEYVIGRIMVKHLSVERFMQQQKDNIWDDRFMPTLAKDTCVGVMGVGAIGMVVLQKLAGIGFQVRGWSRSKKTIAGGISFAGEGEFGEFLSGCDYLVSLLPSTADTHDIIDKAVFNDCKRGCYLINVGRGEQLCADDLLAALDSGQLSGACLDVFRTEPLPADCPFWNHGQIMVTPHIAGVTPRPSGVRHILGLIQKIRQGEQPKIGLYNHQKGY